MSAPLTTPGNTRFVPGSILGNKYRIDGCLGEGGMGVVLSATHLELDAPVAIKIVREEFAGSELMVERVLFEARAVARMRSNHVVRVLDVARLDSGCPYIVMEQLQGVDLGVALWENGPLSVPQAIDYLLQACDGLAEAHSLGIVHRDLKPGNLFLAKTPEGVVLKVLDFGISKEVSTPLRATRLTRTSLTSAGDPVGSPYYMAPEQMRASPDIDARADIWSLGAILFELLTGQCPFEGDTLTEVCGKVLSDPPPSLSAFSNCTATELDVVIARCLEKDPKLRYQTVGELAHALRSWRPSEDVELPQPEPTPRLRRSARLPLAMVGLSALLVLGGVELWQTHGSAASLDSQPIRPVIAAAARSIWQALPEPPIVQPAPMVRPARLASKPAATWNAFQTTTLKETPTIASNLVEPAVVQTQPAAPENAVPRDPEPSDDSVTNDPPPIAPDPVSGRYGL
ncbi:MAG TPA: protein kinase [Polyangiaceae bacterium]|nr:protein kinase [Polyangiaceae bacterium]